MQKHITLDMVRRIAKAGADGRLLAVNTTDLDEGTSRVFDLVAEAQRAADSGQVDRIHNIMLASAGIPGAFPFRMIDDQLYVDGGVTGNIIYGGRIGEEDSLPALWQKTYPNLPIPKMRFWVIFNNQFRPVPQVTPPNWPAVISRSLGDVHARGHGDRHPSSLRDGRDITAQAQGRCRGACRVDPR